MFRLEHVYLLPGEWAMVILFKTEGWIARSVTDNMFAAVQVLENIPRQPV